MSEGCFKWSNLFMDTGPSRCSTRINLGSTALSYIYINDLPNELQSNAKLFADDTTLFAVVNDKNDSANILNNNLIAISKRAFNWKMLFSPDPKKPAQEVLFSRKKQAQFHPTISLNNVEVERAPFHKHLGVMLDEKLNFKQHVDNAIS